MVKNECIYGIHSNIWQVFFRFTETEHDDKIYILKNKDLYFG